MKRLLTELDRCCCCCCFIAFFSIVQALPIQDIGGEVNKVANLNVTNVDNVCIHGNTIYTGGQNFSTSNPCETCTCDPPGFSCSLSSCDLKPGCKAIHKANQCCPEYVCECERNGRIYGNGEKVEEPNPCKVCYCKGGEIKCALVTCYTRDDCEPGYVAGVCCPKYDHCPPLETMKNKSTTPAPALVIISDLKTESDEDVKKTLPRTPVTEATDTTTFTPSSTNPIQETSTSESVTLSTESTTVESSTTYTETTDPDTTITELDLTTELLNDTLDNMERFEVETTADPEFTTTERSLWTTATDDTETCMEDTTTELITSTEENEETTLTVITETAENQTDMTTTENDVRSYSFKETDNTTDLTTTLEYDTTTDPDETTGDFTTVDSEEEFTDPNDLETTTEAVTIKAEETTPEQEKPTRSVVKVIVPKTMKKDIDQLEKNTDGPAPVIVMISADQIQFLKLAEEPPMYVQNRDSDNQKPSEDHKGVVVVPKTTPTTVEMVKVLDGTSSILNVTTESDFVAKDVNTTVSFNSTDYIQER